jgi:Phosphotransferase enzyme family
MNSATAPLVSTPSAACPHNILSYLEEKLGKEAILSVRVEEAKSAQQRVLILFFGNVQFCLDDDDDWWKQALVSGRNRVVVRIWIGASRWWNLNCTQGTTRSSSAQLLQHIGQQEIWGYQSARRALQHTTAIRIPRVLHFSSTLQNNRDEYPWAILEYVGEHSTLFDDDAIVPDESWTTGMTKVREEFGFVEPHPRWGRVPVNESLEYAMNVLQSVILPLHHYYFTETISGSSQPKAYAYMDAIWLYKRTYETILVNHTTERQDALENGDSSDKLQDAIRKLGSAIDRLEKDAASQQSKTLIVALPPVLCHMDFQPQNLMFARRRRLDNEQEDPAAFIVSVLDWEEAAYADPRFELLMMCRKVCANKEQAASIWQKYQEEMAGVVELGPMEPWLKLETVHSLTTLLVQATAGGGRSPWESKPDLWGKIDREFQRLTAAGWTFCNTSKILQYS